MADGKKSIRDALAWLDAVSSKSGFPDGFEVRDALTGDAASVLGDEPDADSVRWAVMRCLDVDGSGSWGQKGIYVWFWRADGSKGRSQSWPLYIGRTRAVKGMRGRHLDDHTANPTPRRGMKDMLCDPAKSYVKTNLMRFSGGDAVSATDKVAPRSSPSLVGKHMVEQFRPMSVLLLPMADDDAKREGLLDHAEGILIAASELLHHEINGAELGALECMMNSVGRANALGIGLEELCKLDEIAIVSRKLRELMDTASGLQ